jgi:N-acetylneuraminic acid mutarotase
LIFIVFFYNVLTTSPESFKTRFKHLFGETVCNVSLIKSRVAFNGSLAFLIEKRSLNMKNGKFLTMIILLAFSLPFAYGGCGGSTSDLVDTGGKPHISNLFYTPESADLGSGGGSIPVFGSFDFKDGDRDVLEMTINLFDSEGNLIDSNSDPIIDAFGKKSGTIEATYNIDTSVEDDYTFKIFVTDQFSHTSNKLTGTFSIINPAWKTRASMPALRKMMGSVTVNGKIYVIGGSDGTTLRDETMVYDPATDSWEFASSIPTDRSRLTVNAVNGKIYAIGGDNLGELDTVEEYDPATDTWTTKTPMSTERSGLASGAVNGKIYAIGGKTNVPVMTVEEYDPATNTWATKTPMPTGRRGLAAAVVNGKIYAIGGLHGGGLSNDVEEYDPATDTWTSKASMPTARRDLTAAVVNGKIYAIGGTDSWANNDVVEEYDPATDSWAIKTAMPTGREYLTASSANQKIYALGGQTGGGGAAGLDTVEEYDPSLD